MGNELSAEDAERRRADEEALKTVGWRFSDEMCNVPSLESSGGTTSSSPSPAPSSGAQIGLSNFTDLPTVTMRCGLEDGAGVPLLRWQGWKCIQISANASADTLIALADQMPELFALCANCLDLSVDGVDGMASVLASRSIRVMRIALSPRMETVATDALAELLCSWLASDAPLSLVVRPIIDNSPEERAWAEAFFLKLNSGLGRSRTLRALELNAKEYGEGVVPAAAVLQALEGHPAIQEVELKDCHSQCDEGKLAVKNIPLLSKLVLLGHYEEGEPPATQLALEKVPLLADAAFLRCGVQNLPACLLDLEKLYHFQISDNISEEAWFSQP